MHEFNQSFVKFEVLLSHINLLNCALTPKVMSELATVLFPANFDIMVIHEA